jgi:pantothenate kinase-related protein Tda10
MEQKTIQKQKDGFFVDNILKQELDRIINAVTKKDRDFVMCIDGEEGCGKSVLAMQIAKYLDKYFNLDKLVFNSDQFTDLIKKVKTNSCVVLDEAYNSANARASLTEVNRSMIAIATEMRQRNLFGVVGL